jgi:two-component system sensor histidine kinase YesM
VEQELVYADAYLYILSERLGERLTIKKAVAPETLKALVPCLILQPIVENAFEHGIALQNKGEIVIRSRMDGDTLIIEVENDGHMSEADKRNVARLLDWDSEAEGGEDNRECVGIRNVNRRLKILYGEEGELTISQISGRRVLARIVIPYVERER